MLGILRQCGPRSPQSLPRGLAILKNGGGVVFALCRSDAALREARIARYDHPVAISRAALFALVREALAE